MSSRTRKTAVARKLEIVEAALKRAGELGPDQITTEALADMIGISQAGIFRHFPSKDDIWEAVAQHIAKLVQSRLLDSNINDAQPGDRLRAMILGHLTFIQATPAIPAILFSRELHAKNEKLRAFFAAMMTTRKNELAKVVSEEVSAGRFRSSLDPDDAAFLILAFIQGLAMRWSLNERKFDLVSEGKSLMELMLEGFATQQDSASASRKIEITDIEDA